MRFGVAEDPGIEHALEHGRAREPKLEMLALDLGMACQQVVDVLPAEDVAGCQAIGCEHPQKIVLSLRREADGGCKQVPRRFKRVEFLALFSCKNAPQRIKT